MATAKSKLVLEQHELLLLKEIVDAELKTRFGSKKGLATKAGLGDSTLRELLNDGRGSTESLRKVLNAFEIPESHPLFKHVQAEPSVEKSKKSSIRLVLALGIVAGIIVATSLLIINNRFASDEDIALQHLQDRGISLTLENTTAHLGAGDADTLKFLASAGVSNTQFEEAFRTKANSFFGNTIGTVQAIDWFKERLNSGLNPDLLVTDQKYNHVGLLYAALQTGNAEMAIALLEAGASPHPYQDLYFVKGRYPFFLYPVQGVLGLTNMSKASKHRITDLMIKNGAAFYSPAASEHITLFGRDLEHRQSSLDELQKALDDENSVGELSSVRRSIRLDFSFERDTRVCEAAERRTGEEWCSLMNTVPAIISSEDRKDSYFGALYVLGLISISDGKLYFKVIHWIGNHEYGVLEVNREQDDFRFFKYFYGSAPFTVKAICAAERYQGCFHALSIKRLSETHGETSYGSKVLFTERGAAEDTINLPLNSE